MCLHQNIVERLLLLGIGINVYFFYQPFAQDMNEPASFVHGTVGGKCLGSDLLENPPYMPRKETAQSVHLIVNGRTHILMHASKPPCQSPIIPVVHVSVCAWGIVRNSVNTSTYPHQHHHHHNHQRWTPWKMG